MRQLNIEWKHYEKEGKTCDRCSATGRNIHEVIQDLQQELSEQNVQITLQETVLPESRISESNMILINGKALEEILSSATTSSSNCPSCACMTGKETDCRTVVHDGTTHEEIPEELIRKAVFQVLDIKQT